MPGGAGGTIGVASDLYIRLLERGERSPNLDTAKAIANALRVPLGKLISEPERLTDLAR